MTIEIELGLIRNTATGEPVDAGTAERIARANGHRFVETFILEWLGWKLFLASNLKVGLKQKLPLPYKPAA